MGAKHPEVADILHWQTPSETCIWMQEQVDYDYGRLAHATRQEALPEEFVETILSG